MAEERSYVGPGILRSAGIGIPRKRKVTLRRAPIIAAVAVTALVVSLMAFVEVVPKPNNVVKTQSVTTLAITLSCQHYDTGLYFCNVPFPPIHPPGPHAWNDSAGVDGIYGNVDDCPHCSAYCAPASISMIASYRGFGAPWNLQDAIYDNGKIVPPEIRGNMVIETHGVGMFHGFGGWPAEVQMAMTWSLGVPIIEHNWTGGNPNGPMTPAQLVIYLVKGTPVLWLDNGGWPANQSTAYPPLSNRIDQGHAKVIGGYDDNNTPVDLSDDMCLIFDPWPEYNDTGIVPLNCTQGPGGTWNPYWQPLNDVNMLDVNDVYLVDTIPAIPEFTAVLLPVLGIMAIAVVAFRRTRSDT